MRMIVPECTATKKIDREEDSDGQEEESKRPSGDQCWNLNCTPPRPTSPDQERGLKLSMINVSSLPPKKREELDRTVEEPEEDSDDEKLNSDSSSHHEKKQLQFYYWDAIRWVEFPLKTNALLGAALKTNSESVVLPVAENHLYKIDFKSKLHMNLKTGYVRSIAWEDSSTGSIDFAGSDKPFERQELLPRDDCRMMISRSQWKHQQQHHDIKSMSAPSALSPSPLPHDHANLNMRIDTAPAAMQPISICPFQSKAVETFGKLGDKVAVLEPGNKEFNAVNNVFNKGFSSRSPPQEKRPRLTAVHKVINNEAKLRYFGEQLQSMERLRGNANLRHAWHGSSADAIVSIVMYGFGQRPMSMNGNNFGCGTYLAPCSKLDVSAQYAEVDQNMEQHVLLCEVVLGISELIAPGSCHRFLPSNTSYDSGVDDLDDPNLYIIWSPFINSHIIPWYIVSFVTEETTRKLSGPWRRSPEIIRPSPYFSSPRQSPILEPTRVNKLFQPSSLRTVSGRLDLVAQASAASLVMTYPPRENNHNAAVHEDPDTCFGKSWSASNERQEEDAARSTDASAETTTYPHHNNNNIYLDGHMSKDDKPRISGKINLNLGLNIDGVSHQTKRHWLAQSLRHQK